MRILCIDGPYFLAAFSAMGHETLSIGATPGLDVTITRPLSLRMLLEVLQARRFTPDAVLWADTCQPPTVAGLESLPWPVVGYSIDQYVNPWHVAYSVGFDLALVAQKDYLPLFTSEHPRPAAWMPLFCDPAHDRDQGLARDVPMSFVGTVGSPSNPERGPFLERVKRLAPLVVRTGEYVDLFGRSQVVLNQSAAGELNFRLFQAMACGAGVLTEDTGNGLRELFTPGVHLALYPKGDPALAARAAKTLLTDPALTDMARAGQAEVLARHSVAVRAATLVGHMRDLIADKAPLGRLRNGPAIRDRMATAYTILAADPLLPLPDQHRRFYLDLAVKTAKG